MTELMMDFSQALIAIKDGKKVTREGWHGKDMYLELQTPQASADVCKMTLPYIYMAIPCQNCAESDEKPSGFNLVPWNVSQTDLLREDWKIVE